jgi:hypothetical protein
MTKNVEASTKEKEYYDLRRKLEEKVTQLEKSLL